MTEPKSLKDSFNDSYTAKLYNSNVLQTSTSSYQNYYDFTARMLIIRADWGKDYNVTTTPFAQVDREVLVAMRDKLVELGGTPPELPPEPATALPRQQKGLNP